MSDTYQSNVSNQVGNRVNTTPSKNVFQQSSYTETDSYLFSESDRFYKGNNSHNYDYQKIGERSQGKSSQFNFEEMNQEQDVQDFKEGRSKRYSSSLHEDLRQSNVHRVSSFNSNSELITPEDTKLAITSTS